MEASISPIRVLYIMGYGRSGSTVLDSVLGNHPDIESVGELINLPRSILNNEFCACSRRTKECDFWKNVEKEWIERTGMKQINEYSPLEKVLKRDLYMFHGLRKPNINSYEFQIYADYTRALYESVKKVSNKSIIVDSSKLPSRAFMLSLIPGIDLRLIHLIRDGRGVAWSLKRTYKVNKRAGVQTYIKSRPVWRSAIAWLHSNMRSAWVRNKLDKNKSIQMRYEEFVNEPRKSLYHIGQLVGVDFNEVASALESGKSINIGHTVAGNRLRMDGKLSLRLDEEWKQKMSKIDQWQFCAIAGCMLKKYHY